MTFIRLQNTKEDIFKYYKQHKTKQNKSVKKPKQKNVNKMWLNKQKKSG